MPYRTSIASPLFCYHAEMDLACTYSLRRPHLARECALTALGAAIRAQRPDLAVVANDLLAAL